MKKKEIAILIGILLTTLSLGSVVQAQVLKRGMRGEEVKMIQEILRQDPEIYPEGLATGYYGPLTEAAVKRLQKRYGLPQTGEIDAKVQAILFPIRYKIEVISPNGGEVWDRNKIQIIKWKVTVAPGISEEELKVRPFWRKASIDLYRRVRLLEKEKPEIWPPVPTSVFVKHIATVDLFSTAYSWKISPDIKNGNDYVIRIGFPLPRPLTPELPEKPISYEGEMGAKARLWPIPRPVWDESDRPFTITGEIPPTPPPSPVLREAIALLEKAIENLNRALEILYEWVE